LQQQLTGWNRVGQTVEVAMHGSSAFGGDEGGDVLRVFNLLRSIETARMLGNDGCGIEDPDRGQ